MVVANARMGMGLQLSMSSRYKLYCDLLLIFCYEYLLDRTMAHDPAQAVPLLRRLWIVAAFSGAALVFAAGDLAGVKFLMARRISAETAMQQYLARPEGASPMFLVENVLNPAEVLEEDKARREMNEAIKLGIYSPPGRMVAEANEARGLTLARPEWFAAPLVDAAGRKTYPAAALAGAYRATAAWGTILLGDASYVSPFYDATSSDPCGGAAAPYRSPRRFVGAGRPHVDDERYPQRLVEGSVLLGEICGATSLQMAHMGVDAGPAVVRTLYGGRRSNGIYLPNHGRFNPRQGTRLEDVAVLTNDLEGQHSVLIEGEDGAVIDGLWLWTPGGTHGLILKSAHSVVRDFHCKGARADCLLLKSDYMTAANGNATNDRLEGIHLAALRNPGDTGGIMLDGSWDTVSEIRMRDVEEESTAFGFSAAGSWFHSVRGVQIDGWKARGITGPCTMFGVRTHIAVVRGDCQRADRPLPPRRRTFVLWCRDAGAALKLETRIVWQTVATWVVLAWKWIAAKIAAAAAA